MLATVQQQEKCREVSWEKCSIGEWCYQNRTKAKLKKTSLAKYERIYACRAINRPTPGGKEITNEKKRRTRLD